MRFIRLLFLMLLTATIAYAEPLSLQNLYFNRQPQNLPEAIILYNSANPCETCHKAIDMIVYVLKNNYRTKMHAYLIDVEKHPEFAAFFKTTTPLTLVIIRVTDNQTEGYATLTGLQSQTGAPEDFNRRITEFINNFLGFY